MPSQGEGDAFKSFAFEALNNLCSALCTIYRSPTLKNLKHYLAGTGSGALASLVIDALNNFILKNIQDGDTLIKKAIASIDPKKRDKQTIAAALIELYQSCGKMETDLDGLISMFTHDSAHFGKMITSLMPVMTMLTSGSLGDLLSPPDDPAEQLKYTYRDTADLIDSNHVVYVGLDSLSDPMVGSAIGALFLSDLACVAGARYNYGGNEPKLDAAKKNIKNQHFLAKVLSLIDSEKKKNQKQFINIFVDEAAEVMNSPAIQLLNKGRGAGFRCFIATQTIADFSARLGNKDKAQQVIANLNNHLCLRCIDPDTQQFFVKMLPKTKVYTINRSQGLSTNASAGATPTGGNLSERMMEEEVPIVPPELLGMLPNLEFFGHLSGGRIIKGRYPLILKDKSEFKR